jgi:hypothetical protein
MSDYESQGTHAELMELMTAAHQAVTTAHRFVHERKPRLDGSGFQHEPVAWRAFKSGQWAFRPHGSEPPADVLFRFGWQPLYTRQSD